MDETAAVESANSLREANRDSDREFEFQRLSKKAREDDSARIGEHEGFSTGKLRQSEGGGGPLGVEILAERMTPPNAVDRAK